MAITLELPPEEEQSLRRQAEMAGREVVDYLREMVRREVRPRAILLPGEFSLGELLSDEERERLLDEFGETAPPGVPLLSDYAMSREGIYEDHD